MATADSHAAVEMVSRLLARGSAEGASDLHLDPTASSLEVSWRVDGVLSPPEHLPRELAPRIAGRLKALADLLVWRTDVPQEGRIDGAKIPGGRPVRVSTWPTLHGERLAVRFQAQAAGHLSFFELGLPLHAEQGLGAALAEPEGVILVTGPSGSGKTTTLYAALEQIIRAPERRSIVTLEDPVERQMPGASQCELKSEGLTVAQAVRSMLRQDPDVMLIGEVRDRATAAAALEAGLTGHLVLSTIHAGTAPKVFRRLMDLGLEPFAITTAIRGVLAQRLVRRTTPDGYEGRVLVAEWLPMTDALRRAIHAGQDGAELTETMTEEGHSSLGVHVRMLIDAGLTDEKEAQRVLGTECLLA